MSQQLSNVQLLNMQEQVVNTLAMAIANKHKLGIKEGTVKVHLSLTAKNVITIQRGPIANIYLQWPAAQEYLKTHLLHALESIVKHKLVEPLSVVPYVHATNSETSKWRREVFGNGDIVANLVPRSRLTVIRTVVTKVIDSETGIEVSVEKSDKPYTFTSTDNMEAWIKVSRLVRAAEEVRDALVKGTEQADSYLTTNGERN